MQISPITSSYIEPLSVTAQISNAENVEQRAVPDALKSKENNNYNVTWL